MFAHYSSNQSGTWTDSKYTQVVTATTFTLCLTAWPHATQIPERRPVPQQSASWRTGQTVDPSFVRESAVPPIGSVTTTTTEPTIQQAVKGRSSHSLVLRSKLVSTKPGLIFLPCAGVCPPGVRPNNAFKEYLDPSRVNFIDTRHECQKPKPEAPCQGFVDRCVNVKTLLKNNFNSIARNCYAKP